MDSDNLTDERRLEYFKEIVINSKLSSQDRYLDKLSLYTLEITCNNITDSLFNLTENFWNKRIPTIGGLDDRNLIGARLKYEGNTNGVLKVWKEYIFRLKLPNKDTLIIESYLQSDVTNDKVLNPSTYDLNCFDTGILAVYRGIIH